MLQRFVLPVASVGSGIKPASGAQLFFYSPGTTTPKITYTDVNGIFPSANPVVANSLGFFESIFLSGTYRVILKDKNGSQIWEESAVQYDYSFDSASEAALTDFSVNGASSISTFESNGSSAISTFESNGSSAISTFESNGSSAISTFESNGSSAISTFESNGASSISTFEVSGSASVANAITSLNALSSEAITIAIDSVLQSIDGVVTPGVNQDFGFIAQPVTQIVDYGSLA